MSGDALRSTLSSLFPSAAPGLVNKAAAGGDLNGAIDVIVHELNTNPMSFLPAPVEVNCSTLDNGDLPSEGTLPPIGSKPFNQLILQPVGAIPEVPTSGYAVSLAKSASVAQLIAVLCEKLGVPCSAVTLSYAGRELDVDLTIKCNGILEPGPAARRAGTQIGISFALDGTVSRKLELPAPEAPEVARARAHFAQVEAARAAAAAEKCAQMAARLQAEEAAKATRLAEVQVGKGVETETAVEARPGVLRTKEGWEISCRIDRSLPAQSLRSLTQDQDPAAIVIREVGSDNTAAFAAICFERMLQREQELEDNFCVFYHSYNDAALLYEVQAEIARCAYGLPDGFAPLPRVQSRHFLGSQASVGALKKVGSLSGRDHNPQFRALAISASPTLFSFGSEAPPLQCFRSGYGCGDLSFRQLLVNTLSDACAVSGKRVGALADELAEAAARWGLRAHNYGNTTSANPGRLGGHMLQIFIARSEVDNFVYHCEPFGIPITTTASTNAWLAGTTGKVDGQVRILFHPELFMNSERGRIFHYCGDWEYLGGDPEMEGSRSAFVLEIRRILRDILHAEGAAEVRKRLSGSHAK